MRHLRRLNSDPALIPLELEMCRRDVFHWYDWWAWTFNPKLVGAQAHIPFDLFPRQRDLVAFIDAKVNAGEDGLVEKSRDIGFTYVTGGYAVHKWLFKEGFKTAFASRNTDLVDQVGNPDSIFEKLRIMLRALPWWMMPEGFSFNRHDNYKRLVNPATGDIIVGEGGDEIGRGGRNSLYVIDEAAFLQHGDRAERSTSANSPCRIWGSTVNRHDDFFAKKRNSGTLREDQVFTYEFKDDPRKDEAWERAERRRLAPQVFKAEYGIDYRAFSGDAFFDLNKLLVETSLPVGDGEAPRKVFVPLDPPERCDAVFAVIDTASKTGKANDGTAVIYFLVNKRTGIGPPLFILDWDIQQIEGALLENWLPTVFDKLEAHAVAHKARVGSLGAWIEDKSSGTVLIQQAIRKGKPVRAIDSKLTAMGKDERALDVSGYVHRGECKISRAAYDKVSSYKGVSRNHLTGQIEDFRLGDPEAAKRADDLLDCFCYSVALALGNAGGF